MWKKRSFVCNNVGIHIFVWERDNQQTYKGPYTPLINSLIFHELSFSHMNSRLIYN